MNEPNMSLEQAQAKVGTLTFPKVTKESIEAKIVDTKYVLDGTLTLCILTMANGFRAIGKSAPASPENFDPEVGQRYAYEDAFRSLWPLEGYTLLNQIAGTRKLLDEIEKNDFFSDDEIEQAAQVGHEVTRAYNHARGDDSLLAWDDEADNIRASAIDGVRFLIANPTATPRDSHNNWMQFKIADGWRTGPIKDKVAKTHPALVPYGDLPEWQRVKDDIYMAAVRTTLGL